MLSNKKNKSSVKSKTGPARTGKTILATAIFALLVMCVPVSQAGTIQGKVLGKDGAPRARARIDLSGPTQLTATTNANGQYRITAPGGTYHARISQQNRRHELYVNIPATGLQPHNFVVDW